MGKRGPKTEDSKLYVLSHSPRVRPEPMECMTDKAKDVWVRIVDAYPPEHFKPQHYDLLRAFCEASAIHEKLISDLEKENVVIKQEGRYSTVYKENPIIATMDKMAARMQGLSVKLQISVNANNASRGKAGEPEKPKSKRSGLLYNG